MEFRMTTDLSVMQPKELTFNFEELYAAIAEQTEKYRSLMVTEDGIAEAKKDRANLRKLADALNSEKIAQKKAFMKPYDAFEAKVKQLIELCKVPADAIDVQIKAFEEAKKAEKKETLRDYFAEMIGEAADYVQFEHVYDPKWLNATVSVETAKETIREACERYNEDVGVLNGLCAETDTSTAYALKRTYNTTRSLSCVMRTKNEIDRELKLQAERKANEEARKKALEALEKKEAAQEAAVSLPVALPHAIADDANDSAVRELCFRVRVTDEQLAALKAFLVENHIWYGRV